MSSSFLSARSLARRFRDADIEPAERVDRKPIANVDDHGGGLGLDDGGPFDGMPGLEIVEGMDIAVAPGAEERLALSAGLALRRRRDRRGLPLARGHRADRGDAGVDEHDLLVARGIGVKLLMPPMKAILDRRDQRRRMEVDAMQRHVDLEDLLAIAHLGGALDLDRPVE